VRPKARDASLNLSTTEGKGGNVTLSCFDDLAARSLGAEVWQTDNLTAALEIARLNARANEVGGITRFTADWTRWTDDRLYDVS